MRPYIVQNKIITSMALELNYLDVSSDQLPAVSEEPKICCLERNRSIRFLGLA